MGSKNLKQALTLNKAEKPYIKTGKEKRKYWSECTYSLWSFLKDTTLKMEL